ncbi:nramp1 [Symbiodinium natans]|uniref:Nramp1 protein n=1 Tax=Symbiodinium natans TaxID=878477 RepID=A0A812TU10_9DINO|nr:nramp1 [Symbiodinium natans]
MNSSRGLLALLCFLLVDQPSGRIIRLGGTLPLSRLSAVERASLQGLQLLAARLNQSTPFSGQHSLPLKLRVQVEDDLGDSDKAAEIYARMLQNQEVDYLFALHGSEMFKVAVDAGDSAGVLTLLSGGPYLLGSAIGPQLHSPWTFSADVQVQDLMGGVLDLVQQQEPPASSVALVWDAGSSFDKQMCAGASSHAQRLGMEVLDNMSFAEQAIMPQMRQLKAADPDLLIACGNLRSAEQILASASTLGFIPRGIALTAMSTREAVRSIGAHLANYVLSPLAWEPSSQSCPVFGSAFAFADAYRAKFREEPLPDSAAAAAGGIALLAAIQAAGSLEQTAVREALLTREQQTCYGRLAFNEAGLRRNPVTLVQQVQPLDEDQPKMDRWTSAQIVTASQETLLGWPLPSWVQKEIDVYPCIPGQAVVLDIGGNATTCTKCPAGRYRTPRSVECEDCQPGTYGMQSGMSQCDVCPSGAACRNSEVVAKPGFYQLPTASLQEGTFVPCYPQHLCTGNNQCTEAHQGILCQGCEFGFSKPLWGLKREVCTKCPSQRVTVGSIALTISVYVLYIWLIVKGTKSASQSMRALPSVILKIGVNYIQFAGTAFEATNFKAMVSTICGEGSATWIFPIVALPERLQYPLTTLISLDCILPLESSVRPYQVEILVGLTLMPAAFFIMTFFAFVRKDCIGKRLVPWLRRRRARYKERKRKREAELGVIVEADQEEEEDPEPCGTETVHERHPFVHLARVTHPACISQRQRGAGCEHDELTELTFTYEHMFLVAYCSILASLVRVHRLPWFPWLRLCDRTCSDVKLLRHVMGMSLSMQATEVVARVSEMAAAALRKLCAEIRAGKVGRMDSMSELELFQSPVAETLGIRTLQSTLPGQLLGFYPGIVMEASEPNLPKSDKLFANEYDGMYLDGKGWLPLQWRDHSLLEGQSRAIWHANRLAVGNLLNHPPADTLPNCVPMAFRWPTWSELGEENPALWARLLPHVFMRQGRVVQTASGRKDSQEGAEFPPWPYMGMAFIAVLEMRAGEDYPLTPMPGPRIYGKLAVGLWHGFSSLSWHRGGNDACGTVHRPVMGSDEQWQLLPELEYTDAVDSWNVRASPELDAYVLCALQHGQPFSVLEEHEDWVHVRTENGVKGWSYKKFGDRQVLVPVSHIAPVHAQPDLSLVSGKVSGDLSELMSELGERRRSLSEAPPTELVRAAHGVQKTMAKLELYGIEQEIFWEKLLAAESQEDLAAIQKAVEDFSVELCRSSSYKHSEFQNPEKDSCWLSTFFQSLWHSRVFHALFDSLVRPLPSQGAGAVSDALRETWELYEQMAASGRPVPIQFLVNAWGSGYGDCAEAFAKLQEDPCLKPLAELIASVPVHFSGAVFTASELWKEVEEMGVEDAPLLALDLVLPSMNSGSILNLVLAMVPRGKAREEHVADLGDSHNLVAMICYIEAVAHYVVFCRRQSDDNCWLFFNDLPGVARGIRKEFFGWVAIAHECARFELRPKVLLYESAKKAEETMKSGSPTLRASIQAAAAAKLHRTPRGLWSLGVCILVVVIALLVHQLREIQGIMRDSVGGDRLRDGATKVVNSVATRFVNSVIVMSFILHPVVVRILVVGFECEELDVLRHRHDLGVECKSDSHMQWLGLSTVGLVVYGIGVPVALFIALFRVRKRLFRAEVRKRFGFLYNGFELRYYYFESVYMFRKVMILLFFTAPTMYVRMVLMLFTSFGFILLHVYSGPFDNRSYVCLDRLEALNLLALTATVSARLIFDIRQELSGEFFEEFVHHWTMDILLVRTFAAYVGPGWLMSLAYLDPGNLESDLQSGAFTGHSLLWVLLLCTVAGLILQILAARLAVVTGRDLAQTCRLGYPLPLSRLLWVMTELAIIGADIQEVVGTGIALQVLFGWPLWVGSLATGVDTFTFLLIHYLGKRFLEVFILVLISLLLVCYLVNFFFMPPSPAEFFHGFLFKCSDYAVLQLVGTVGAVIMPHNLYLHSGICKQRTADRKDVEHVRQANKYTAVDSSIALLISFLINAALVSTFATGFFSEDCAQADDGPLACMPSTGYGDSCSGGDCSACRTKAGSAGFCGEIGLAEAGNSLRRVFGGNGEVGRTMFALGLLAAGQASTMTGTMAGQYVMEGFLDWRIPIWLRTLITRLISLGPAVAVAVLTSSSPNLNNRVDQWINVLQSVQLPFALLPVLHFNSDQSLMGEFVLACRYQVLCWLLAVVVISVNVYLVAQFMQGGSLLMQGLMLLFFIVYGALITFTISADLKRAYRFLAGPLLAHGAFIWFALWSLFRNTVLKHLLLKADIWPEKMSRCQRCLLGLEIHKQKAAFDEDERGLWIDTSSLSKQERHYMFVAMCDTLHRYMNSSQRVHPGDVTAAVQEALVRCRRARRKRAVRLEQLDREFREQRQHGRRGCLSRLVRWQRVMNVSLYGDRQNEMEQEPGCLETLLNWAVADPGRRVRGLPQKALHMEMEQTHEFLAEEFYDALLPVWQEITEGRGPQVYPRQEEQRRVTCVSQLMPQRQAPDASEDSSNKDGEKDEVAGSMGSLHGSTMRLEALLGRTQPSQTDRAESGGLERFLCRARSGCRIELPDLLRAHDELMAENLHLQKENEALRTRLTSPQHVSPGTRSGYASPKSHRTEAGLS